MAECENLPKLKGFIQNKIGLTEHIKKTETLFAIAGLEEENPD